MGFWAGFWGGRGARKDVTLRYNRDIIQHIVLILRLWGAFRGFHEHDMKKYVMGLQTEKSILARYCLKS